MDPYKKIRTATLLTVALLALSSVATAQEFKEGATEAVAYLGGIDGGGGHFTIGGGYSYAPHTRWQIIGELGYVAGGGNGIIGISVNGVEFGGNVHYLFPLTAYPKFTPYALGGIGIIHYSVSCGVLGDCGSFGATTGGVNFGGGARWQVGNNWGVRPEIKFLAGNHFATRFSAGVYYQFGK
jgi:hypothetical protein